MERNIPHGMSIEEALSEGELSIEDLPDFRSKKDYLIDRYEAIIGKAEAEGCRGEELEKLKAKNLKKFGLTKQDFLDLGYPFGW